jgi:hypothetical protein
MIPGIKSSSPISASTAKLLNHKSSARKNVFQWFRPADFRLHSDNTSDKKQN